MVFVRKQADLAGKCCSVLTFDQPLYARAVKIHLDCPEKFSKVFLRIGGFHQLMSFLGALCKLMEGSGFEQVLETVYAANSIPKMMSGKSYTRILRALLLLDCAVHNVLVNTYLETGIVSQLNWDKMISELTVTYTMLMNNDISLQDAANTSQVLQLYSLLEQIHSKYSSRRTAHLWLNLCKCISIVRRFIQAERSILCTNKFDILRGGLII